MTLAAAFIAAALAVPQSATRRGATGFNQGAASAAAAAAAGELNGTSLYELAAVSGGRGEEARLPPVTGLPPGTLPPSETPRALPRRPAKVVEAHASTFVVGRRNPQPIEEADATVALSIL